MEPSHGGAGMLAHGAPRGPTGQTRQPTGPDRTSQRGRAGPGPGRRVGGGQGWAEASPRYLREITSRRNAVPSRGAADTRFLCIWGLATFDSPPGPPGPSAQSCRVAWSARAQAPRPRLAPDREWPAPQGSADAGFHFAPRPGRPDRPGPGMHVPGRAGPGGQSVAHAQQSPARGQPTRRRPPHCKTNPFIRRIIPKLGGTHSTVGSRRVKVRQHDKICFKFKKIIFKKKNHYLVSVFLTLGES